MTVPEGSADSARLGPTAVGSAAEKSSRGASEAEASTAVVMATPRLAESPVVAVPVQCSNSWFDLVLNTANKLQCSSRWFYQVLNTANQLKCSNRLFY